MKYTYQIHPLVEKDFEDGYIWYEEKQKGLGERFVNAVDTTIKHILQNPEAYGSRVKNHSEKHKWINSLIWWSIK